MKWAIIAKTTGLAKNAASRMDKRIKMKICQNVFNILAFQLFLKQRICVETHHYSWNQPQNAECDHPDSDQIVKTSSGEWQENVTRCFHAATSAGLTGHVRPNEGGIALDGRTDR